MTSAAFGDAGSPVNRFYIEQTLKIVIPEALQEHLYYSTEEVVAQSGYLGGAAEIKGPGGAVVGVLVLYPSTSLKVLQGK